MMGRRKQGQGQLFYEFRLDEAVPDDHLVRKIGALLDLSWVYAELVPYYSKIGRRRLRCRADGGTIDRVIEAPLGRLPL
jgi:hypothetical protein